MAPDRKDVKPARSHVSTIPNTPRLATTSPSRQLPRAPRVGTTASPSSTSSSPARPTPSHGNNLTSRPKTPKDRVTPVPNYISPNVTPRTASRKSKADSGQSTSPEISKGETRNTRPSSLINFGASKVENSGRVDPKLASTFNSNRRRSSTSTFSSPNFGLQSNPLLVNGSTASQNAPNSASQTTSFFYANDAPSQTTSPRPGLQKQSSGFFYADGQKEHVATINPKAVNPAGLTPTRTNSHDSDIPSAKSFSPEMKPSLFPLTINAHPSSFFRPPSPTKEFLHLSYRKGASQIMRPKVSQYHSSSALSEELDAGTPEEIGMQSKQSLVSEVKAPTMASSSASDQAGQVLQEGSAVNNPVVPPTPILDRRSSVQELPSPTLADGNSQWFKDVAANARRERKLLDLEISNTSLLAINRSLEREVRKQKLDLRRFRRLSRAATDRTSWVSDSQSATSYEISGDGLDGFLPDLYEENDELDENSDLESIDEGSMSPTALAQSDARHRQSDARRLRLDLAKHKQLLIDSQKMNQSIQRCLGWTEQLIKDGNKALLYQVNLNELKLGGRVLSPEEVEEKKNSYFQINHDDSNESSDINWRNLEAGIDATDKDSGVDVDFTYRTNDRFQPPASSTGFYTPKEAQ